MKCTEGKGQEYVIHSPLYIMQWSIVFMRVQGSGECNEHMFSGGGEINKQLLQSAAVYNTQIEGAVVYNVQRFCNVQYAESCAQEYEGHKVNQLWV